MKKAVAGLVLAGILFAAGSAFSASTSTAKKQPPKDGKGKPPLMMSGDRPPLPPDGKMPKMSGDKRPPRPPMSGDKRPPMPKKTTSK